MNHERWAERQFKVVEQDGSCAARIRLTCVNDQSCLEMWEPGSPTWGDAAAWAREATELIDQWLREMPAKPISLLFVSEDKTGQQRASCPMTVRGTNREASADLLKGRDVKALAESMDSISRTVDRVLATANGQLDRSNSTLETLTKAHADVLDYLRVKHENEALKVQEQQTTNTQIMNLVNQFGGPLLELIGAHIKMSPAAQKVATAAASAVASAAAASAQASQEQAPPTPQPDPSSIPTEGQPSQ